MVPREWLADGTFELNQSASVERKEEEEKMRDWNGNRDSFIQGWYRPTISIHVFCAIFLVKGGFGNDYIPVKYYVVKDIPKVLKYSILYRLLRIYAGC